MLLKEPLGISSPSIKKLGKEKKPDSDLVSCA